MRRLFYAIYQTLVNLLWGTGLGKFPPIYWAYCYAFRLLRLRGESQTQEKKDRDPNLTKHFLFGYFGYRNTGDDAMLYGWLLKMNSNDEALVLSREPSIIPDRKVTWVSRNIPKVIAAIIHSDRFILAGGTLFSDYGKAEKVIVGLMQLLLPIILAKVLGKKIVFDSIGITCSKLWSKLLIKTMCKMANDLTIRDTNSKDILDSFGIKSTLSKDLSSWIPELKLNAIKDMKCLCINVSPLNEIYFGDKKSDIEKLRSVAAFTNKLVENGKYERIKLLIFRDRDTQFTWTLKKMLKCNVRIAYYNRDPVVQYREILDSGTLIAMKYHACLFAEMAGVPCISISEHPKNKEFKELVSLATYTMNP